MVESLPLMEAFYTIQGEGYYQGSAAYFIRLAGCDVGCVWCDVKESWETNNYPVVSVSDMVSGALEFSSKIAVVTGGEPLMHDLAALTHQLKRAGFRTHIETSGAYPLTGSWNWICFSPKKFKKPLPEIYNRANELKVVIYNRSDFKWAEEFREKVNPSCRLYLQPEWSRQESMMPLIIEFVKNRPEWEISLQIHKFMNIP